MIHVTFILLSLIFYCTSLVKASTSAELLISALKETYEYDSANNQTSYTTNYTNKEMNSFVDLYISDFYKLNEHKPYLIKGSDYNISVFDSHFLDEIDCTQCLNNITEHHDEISPDSTFIIAKSIANTFNSKLSVRLFLSDGTPIDIEECEESYFTIKYKLYNTTHINMINQKIEKAQKEYELYKTDNKDSKCFLNNDNSYLQFQMYYTENYKDICDDFYCLFHSFESKNNTLSCSCNIIKVTRFKKTISLSKHLFDVNTFLSFSFCRSALSYYYLFTQINIPLLYLIYPLFFIISCIGLIDVSLNSFPRICELCQRSHTIDVIVYNSFDMAQFIFCFFLYYYFNNAITTYITTYYYIKPALKVILFLFSCIVEVGSSFAFSQFALYIKQKDSMTYQLSIRLLILIAEAYPFHYLFSHIVVFNVLFEKYSLWLFVQLFIYTFSYLVYYDEPNNIRLERVDGNPPDQEKKVEKRIH